ncbi:glycoside hydrolase family 65 protein [Companilactobacillus alimentarius]|uniref:glycoside hydrolase family 65 protein n=1 Tax=Companilactobacillus alimentarius TaxID=1602 RepID=UPI0028B80AC6|nr:glycosyl hydrolase family 65 protein [Companilactobacillus alimentarius]MDT6952984.1 glycosyl hydrolase family 65 protein [Companilactobacillus alimentarius]
MKYCVDTKENDNWYIGTEKFNPQAIDKSETVMFQGNGYLGIRAAPEEKSLCEKRDMFVAGTFDAFKDEVTELPNLPDILNIRVKINQQLFSLSAGTIQNYQKYLNLKDGELIRKFDWLIADQKISFKFSRFISMSDKHLFVSKVEIISKQNDVNVQIVSGIDGQVSNSGTQHLVEGDKRLFDDKIMQFKEQTQQSGIKFIFNVEHKSYIDEVLLNNKSNIKMNRRQIFDNYDVDLMKNQKFTFVKYANVYTSIDGDTEEDDISDVSIQDMKKNCLFNYAELLNKSIRAWNTEIWQRSLVEIKADDNKPQVAVNFARYQLAANTPPDSRMNIGSKGLTGEGYKGHTFWDTEIFMMPYFIFTMPEVARNLLRYRYLGLDGARKKAKSNGYQGAQFLWESAWPTDGEMTPPWGSVDIVTGKPMKVLSGFLEQHVTSDVVIAVMEYLYATEDKKFAEEMGYEIILDAAKFWNSRLEWNDEQKYFEIKNVIGPDEYKEHVNNNAFTNFTAYWCIQKAISIVGLLKNSEPEIYDELNYKLNLDDIYQDWLAKVDLIYLPKANDNNVIPEDDTYLQKPVIAVDKYQSTGGHAKIFKDYDLKEVDKLQVTKQADVLLLIYLFEDMFNKKIEKANWDYYEPKTTHDSSLSLATHAILASDLHLEKIAYKYFERACEVDLGTHLGKVTQGLHMGATGGIWNMVVEGFGGLRVLDSKLRIEPNLPKSWNSLQYQINWHNSLVRVLIDKNKLKISVMGEGIKFINHDKIYQVQANSKLELPISDEVTVEKENDNN